MPRHLFLAMYGVYRDWTFTIGEYRFGLVDAEHNGRDVTLLHAGPLGHYYHVPFTATQGMIIAALLLVAILSAIAWLCLRTRRHPPTNT